MVASRWNHRCEQRLPQWNPDRDVVHDHQCDREAAHHVDSGVARDTASHATMLPEGARTSSAFPGSPHRATFARWRSPSGRRGEAGEAWAHIEATIPAPRASVPNGAARRTWPKLKSSATREASAGRSPPARSTGQTRPIESSNTTERRFRPWTSSCSGSTRKTSPSSSRRSSVPRRISGTSITSIGC